MRLVFGSSEARAVLLEDFQRRNGHIRIAPESDATGGKIAPPAHYVAGDWRDVHPVPDEDEEEGVFL